jgi:hypothetical protein
MHLEQAMTDIDADVSHEAGLSELTSSEIVLLIMWLH